jgi:hypothetical protein
VWWWLACAVQPEPAEVAPIARQAAPVPVWGGNLLARADGGFVAADAASDRLYFGRVTDGALEVDPPLYLEEGSRPWRMAESPDGAVWVSLRGGGGLARVLDGAVSRFEVCADPRGVWADADGVEVACAGGELVSLDLNGAEVDRLVLVPDLRDVIRVGGERWVTTFRDAALWVVAADGTVTERRAPEVADRRASVAWRLSPDPLGGGALLAHQRARTDLVDLTVLGLPAYGSDACDAAVEPAFTRFFPDGTAETSGPLRKSVLPVDLLAEPSGELWVVAAGADGNSDVGVGWLDPTMFTTTDGCSTAPGYPWSAITRGLGGRVTAVAAVDGGRVFAVQAPFGLALADDALVVEQWWAEDAVDRGVHLFHAAPVGALSCASCHPEGGEDGQVWRFGTPAGEQSRRTQSLAGGLSPLTAPLHWDGALVDLPALLTDTYEVRMGGTLYGGDSDAFATFLAQTPAAPRAATGPSEGEAEFIGARCAVCHVPPLYTDGLNHDVGTGEVLQTPSLLGLGARGPWMHDGCAATLLQRFDPECGGEDHGGPIEDLDALVAWLAGL